MTEPDDRSRILLAHTALSRRSVLGLGASALAMGLLRCSPKPPRALRISGSNTVYFFARDLAVAYAQTHRDVMFRITGDGTSRGIKFAGEGDIQGLAMDFTNRNKIEIPTRAGEVPHSRNGEPMDIGLSSRQLFRSETEAYSAMVATTFAYDGIAVVTHRGTTVPNLSLMQLRQIYSGMITNWSMVGGPSAPIVVIARDALSGTAEAWGELVMNGLPVMSQMNVSMAADVPMAVASTPNSIAYLSLAQIDPAMMNPVSIENVMPTVEQLSMGRYPIRRPFVFVTGGPPTVLQRDYIDFAFSPAGRAVIEALEAVVAVRMT
ncbi:MAG: phosphate ABC transporter substrate-binding protein [Deltaproteobacteria bacterium]|nr:phosphate ABC transporter substrate-binding protein [Deltaproteobacteria bacterium]